MSLFNKKKKTEEAAAPSVAENKGLSPEIVAVISAAVFCMFGAGAGIVSIRKAKRQDTSKRSWRLAGLLDNTKAF